MKPVTFCLTLVLLLAAAVPSISRSADPQLAHMVFFTLKENTPDHREKLVAGCKKYLSGHEGVVYFSAGARADDLQRDVNDTEFDVALHVVFRDKAAHGKYQVHPRHLQFIKEYSEMWSGVRVFDSLLPGMKFQPVRLQAAVAPDRPAKRIALPDPASLFAGMIRGKVIEKREGQFVLQVEEVTRKWRTNRAENAEAMVGKPVLVGASDHPPVRRFVDKLPVGETVEVDVAHKGGEVLTILELTADQRK